MSRQTLRLELEFLRNLSAFSRVPEGRAEAKKTNTNQRGHCGSCGQTIGLRKDSTLGFHLDYDGRVCPGGGEPPLQTTGTCCFCGLTIKFTSHTQRHYYSSTPGQVKLCPGGESLVLGYDEFTREIMIA